MILRQFLHSDLIAASYFLGCVGYGIGAVVDPVFPLEPYLTTAATAGVEIRYVIDTHLHADHVSAGRALAEAAKAEYVLHQTANTGFAFREVVEGDTLELGNVVLEVLHTPGHTLEHVCLLVADKILAPQPWFLLSGHTLMVGDFDRTELATDAATGARTLFKTLQRLKKFPDYIEILPGAFAGSVCGRGLSGKPSSTLGFERLYNPAFAINYETHFVEFMLANISPVPQEAAAYRASNSGLASRVVG